MMEKLCLSFIKIRCNNISKLNKSLDRLKRRNVFKLESIKHFDTKENTGQKINYICAIGRNWRGAPYEDIDYNTATLKPDKSQTVSINGLDEWFRYNNVLDYARWSGFFGINCLCDNVHSMEHFKKCRAQIMPISAYKTYEW